MLQLEEKDLPQKKQAEMVRSKMNTLDVVAISETTKLLLTSCVPHIVCNVSSVCAESQRVYLYSQGGWGGEGDDNYLIMSENNYLQLHFKTYFKKMGSSLTDLLKLEDLECIYIYI